jgi:hypothetical protein
MSTSLHEIALQLTELSTSIKDLKVNLPQIIRTELDKHHNKRKVVVYGISEHDGYDIVYDIFMAYGIASREITILHRLGRASLERAGPRPLVVHFSDKVAYPHLITLANIIKNNPLWNHVKVRKLETPEERHQGFLLREERRKRDAESVPTTEQVVTPRKPEVTESKSCAVAPAVKANPSKVVKQCSLEDFIAEVKEPAEKQKARKARIKNPIYGVYPPSQWEMMMFKEGRDKYHGKQLFASANKPIN